MSVPETWIWGRLFRNAASHWSWVMSGCAHAIIVVARSPTSNWPAVIV